MHPKNYKQKAVPEIPNAEIIAAMEEESKCSPKTKFREIR